MTGGRDSIEWNMKCGLHDGIIIGNVDKCQVAIDDKCAWILKIGHLEKDLNITVSAIL